MQSSTRWGSYAERIAVVNVRLDDSFVDGILFRDYSNEAIAETPQWCFVFNAQIIVLAMKLGYLKGERVVRGRYLAQCLKVYSFVCFMTFWFHLDLLGQGCYWLLHFCGPRVCNMTIHTHPRTVLTIINSSLVYTRQHSRSPSIDTHEQRSICRRIFNFNCISTVIIFQRISNGL